ncbi:UNVERIFIED_CONTAM: hypothetical protein K2H54_057096 [Gekko kuhli]
MAAIGEEEEWDWNMQVGELTVDQFKRLLIESIKETVTTVCKDQFNESRDGPLDLENKEDRNYCMQILEEQQQCGQERELWDIQSLPTQDSDQDRETCRIQNEKNRTRTKLIEVEKREKKSKGTKDKKSRDARKNFKKHKGWTFYVWKMENMKLRRCEFKDLRHIKEFLEKKMVIKNWGENMR